MKTHTYTHLLILFTILASFNNLYSQKDTLHIYYLGLQTKVLDSNEVKIANWAKSLKGRHVDVEIYAYYDNSSYKEYMVERAENLNMIVTRKARDFMTLNFSGPVKGKKTQRLMADIVYTSANANAPQKVAEEKKDHTAVSEPVKSATPAEKKSQATKPVDKEDNKPVATEKKEANKTVSNDKQDDYVIDSVYVNGMLKVTKKKIKKK